MKKSLLILVIVLSGFTAAPSSAKDVIQIIIKKQEQKKKYRWSINEWFKVKSAMRMQDLWFAMNAPSPYEFYLGADYVFGKTRGTQNPDETWRVFAAAYARIFGLEFQKVFRNEEWLGIFNLRIFGRYVQSTNITLQGGIRSQNAGGVFRNWFAGSTISIYIMKSFGVEGLFRHYFTGSDADSGIKVWGNRWEAKAFIDYKVMRVYFTYFTESERIVTGNPTSFNNLSGFAGGVKLFF